MLRSTQYIFQITSTLSSKRFMMLMAYEVLSCCWAQNIAQSLGEEERAPGMFGNVPVFEEIYISQNLHGSPGIKSRAISRAMISLSQQAKCGIIYHRRIYAIVAEMSC